MKLKTTWPAGMALAAMLMISSGARAQMAPQESPAPSKPAAPAKARTRMPYDPALVHPATLNAKAPQEYEVKFTTTKGDFTVKVTRAWAPLGADRFYNLCQHHFYDDASFFRVLSGFVVQFGLSAYPAVSAAWSRATVKDDPVKMSNKPGFLTFATAGPNTRTTQVFINLGDNAQLDKMGFSPFGQVTEGIDVVKQLYAGYGEGAPSGRGPAQDQIEAKGKAYLDAGFPKLDSIKTAVIISPAPAANSARAPKAPAKKP